MNVTWKKVAGLLVTSAMMTSIASLTFTPSALAAGSPNQPAIAQPKPANDKNDDLKQLRPLIEALRTENKQEHSLRQQLNRDMKEISRLVQLSRSAQVTDDLKQALAEVESLKQDLKVIHETQQQWQTEGAIFQEYRRQKALDKAIAQAGKLKGILEQEIDQLQSAHAKAEKVIADLKKDLHDDQIGDLGQLGAELKTLKGENAQETSLRARLEADITTIDRLAALSRDAQQTDDLKQALAEVERLHADLQVIHETHQQWETEWAAFKDYRQHKQLDQAIAQMAKLKSILELQIDQIQNASTKAGKLIQDLEADLRAVGIDPDQV